MSEQGFPPELVDAQRAFWTAEKRVAEIVARLPSGAAIVAGEAAISEEDRAELEEARAERGRLVEFLYAHEFWKDAPEPERLRQALRRVARES